METALTANDSVPAVDRSTSAPVFSEAVESDHLRLDADAWNDIYVVGDVHGCLSELRTLVDRLDPAADDLLVFVGDLIRKGPDSRGVVEFVRERPNAVSVRGNNEEKFVTGRTEVPDLDDTPEADYVRSLPAAISWDDALVVHGGVDPRRRLDDHEVADLQTTRALTPGNDYDGPFWFDEYARTPRVFFGHTVLADPLTRDSAVGLDTGCVYGGALTAYDYRRDRVVSVDAERTYQTRPDRKIVDLS